MSSQIDYGNPHRKRLVALYTIGLLFPFVQSLLYIIGFPHSADVFRVTQPIWLAVMGMCICGLFFIQPDAMQKISVTMWLLVAAMVWIMVRVLADRYLFYENDPEYIWVRALIAWFFFYPVGRLLTRQELRRAVIWLAAIWGGGMVLLSIVGIVASVCGLVLYMPGEETIIGMVEGRLVIAYHPVTTAQYMVMAGCFALFLMFSYRKWWVLLPCGLCVAIAYVGVGLVDGTNAMLTLGLLLGMAAFVLVTDRLSPRTWRGIAIGCMAALVVLAISYSVNTKVRGWLATPPTQRIYVGELLHSRPASEPIAQPKPVAQPEPSPEVQTAPAKGAYAHHEMSSGGLHGRLPIWKSTLHSLLTNERNCLLIGATALDYDDLIQPPDFHAAHTHNMYLQVVINWGLPGLMIMVTFLAFFAISAFRLLFTPGVPSWERFVPCMALAALFSEVGDCFSALHMYTVPLYLLFLFLGMTIGVDFHERNSRP